MGRVTHTCRVVRIDTSSADPEGGVRTAERPDTLAAEEPLEIRVSGQPLAVTMRTPGDDFDLVAGFLVGEGIIAAQDDLRTMRVCSTAPALGAPLLNGAPRGLDLGLTVDADNGNSTPGDTVDTTLAPDMHLPPGVLDRAFPVTSACGVCGKARIDDITTRTRWPVSDDPVRLSPTVLTALPATLRSAQRVFDRTGGLHAAALFDAEGTLRCLREDVGRHNAVDKVIGWAFRAGELPLRGHVLMVSGRASFELTQKAVCAGIPALAAVSAPSSMAVDLAQTAGLTLVGFLRGATMNVYARADRVTGREN